MIIYDDRLGAIWGSSGRHLGVRIIPPMGMIYPTSPPNHPPLGTGMHFPIGASWAGPAQGGWSASCLLVSVQI